MNFLQEENKKSFLHLGIIGVVIAITYLFFEYIFSFIAPFFMGWLLSLLFHPLVTFLEKKYHIPRWIGSLFSILLLLAFFSIVVVGIWNKLYAEATLFVEKLPEYVTLIQDSLNPLSAQFVKWKNSLPSGIQTLFPKEKNPLSTIISSVIQAGSSHSFRALVSVSNGFMILIVTLISAHFFTKDKAEIADFAKKHTPPMIEKPYHLAKKELKTSLVAYFKTQLILMGYTFMICLIGLLILRSPYAFLLSVITSIIDAIPFFGSGFILWPGALIYFLTGKTALGVGYIIIYLCINLMRQIMQPKILGTQIGLHPLLTLISMYIGLKCLGILGMILGPIVAVLLKAVYQAKESIKSEKPPLDS